MPKLAIENKQLNYHIQGNGIPLVMIHGSLCRHRLWDEQLTLTNHAQLVRLDLPGHGESEPLDGVITIERFARIVAQLVQKLGLKTVVAVGHSLGGAVALQLALDYSSLLKGLILIGTGAKLGVLPAILEGLRTDFSRGVELSIGQLGFAEGASPNSVEFAKTECLRCDSKIGYWDFVACNAFDMRNRIHEVALPTLVLVGDEDQLTPVKWAEYLADKITNAQLKVISQAGHFVMLERPDEVNQAIIDYLQQL